MKWLSTIALMAALPIGAANASLIYMEDFESGLGGWTGKAAGPHDAVISTDPIEGDSAVRWRSLEAGGESFSIASFAAGTYTLVFDYLGLPEPGSSQSPGDFGGFIGISAGFPGVHRWLEGTVLCCGAESSTLLDDGMWHTYSVTFTAAWDFHIMLEDFSGSGGIPGDAWFDDIKLFEGRVAVAEPLTIGLVTMGLLGLGFRRRRS